jgi:hypothetical protein
LGKSGVLFVIRDVDNIYFAETKWDQTPGRLLRNQRNGAVCVYLVGVNEKISFVMSDRRIPRIDDTFCRKQTKDIAKPAATDTATKDDMHELMKLYDEISDSCAVWNVDVCRRETFTQRGKGTCVYMRDLRVMCDVMFDLFMCGVCDGRVSSHNICTGIFAMRDLPEGSVVAKYEGHLVTTSGKIVIECTRTAILFSHRVELDRTKVGYTGPPFSREHCASIMVGRQVHTQNNSLSSCVTWIILLLGKSKQSEDRWNSPHSEQCGSFIESWKRSMGRASELQPRSGKALLQLQNGVD